jgi:hypothetical protein
MRFKGLNYEPPPLVIDPEGCGCTDCLTCESKPIDRVDRTDVADLLALDQRVINRTGRTDAWLHNQLVSILGTGTMIQSGRNR